MSNMAAPRPKKRALSDRLKNMRFMKRHEESGLREKLLRQQEQREKETHWTTEPDGQATPTTPIVLIEDGISCERRIGRQSFGNFNKVFEDHTTQSSDVNIEKCMQYDYHGRDEKQSKEEPPTIAEGFTRREDLNSDAHPLLYRKINLQGASKSITKKTKRRPKETLGYPGKPGNHRRNPL